MLSHPYSATKGLYITLGKGDVVHSTDAKLLLTEIATASLKIDDDQEQPEVYRIGYLANEFGVSLRTLRFYEDRGLITPKRAGSTRLYSGEDRARLKVILLAKSVGFSLIDIEELLALYDNESSQDETLSIRQKFEDQSRALKVKRNELDESITNLEKALKILDNSSE